MVNHSGEDYTIHIHGELSNRASKIALMRLLVDLDNYMLVCLGTTDESEINTKHLEEKQQ